MLHKVRALYAQDDSEALSGEVECDEVYRRQGKMEASVYAHSKYSGTFHSDKTPVFGMVERSEIETSKGEVEFMSYIRAMVVEKTDRATLEPIIGQFVANGSTVFTDELSA